VRTGPFYGKNELFAKSSFGGNVMGKIPYFFYEKYRKLINLSI